MTAIHLIGDDENLHRVKIHFHVEEKNGGKSEPPSAVCFETENKLFCETSVDVEFFSPVLRNEFAKANQAFQSKLKRLDALNPNERNAFCDAVIEIFEQLKQVNND